MQEFPIFKEALVSRTPDGLAHGNTLILRLKVVVVYLDIPHLAKDSGNEGYRLLSQTAGKYDRTLKREDAIMLNDKRVALYFTEVYPFGTYSLYQCVTPEIKLPIFLDVPFDDLPSFGSDAPMPEPPAKDEPVSFETPPQLKTVDPLVHPHVLDCSPPASDSSFNVLAMQLSWRRPQPGDQKQNSDNSDDSAIA